MTSEEITQAALNSFGSADPRLRELMTALVHHLHVFAVEVGLTSVEWSRAIQVLTETGQITDETRQEFILWSDTLGLSMLVDSLENRAVEGETESTVLGPFYVPDTPLREYGANIALQPAGEPAWVYGCVRSAGDGEPIRDAELDVWQNGDDRLYAVQNPDTSEEHLRGKFRTRHDGSFGFLAVRPVPYPIPDDGPVGAMLRAVGRHPWRPAHIHMIVRAEGHRTLTTHIFDADSQYLDSDAVFAVKPSLLRKFIRHAPSEPQTPTGVDREWYSVETNITLASLRATPGS